MNPAARRLLLAALLGLAVQAGATGERPPGSVLDLSRWKLTLPEDTELPGRPDEVLQPDLSVFVRPGLFFSPRGGGVAFRGPCGGVTTRGSRYPRCELREMQAGVPPRLAAWSTDGARPRVLSGTVAITALPAVKPHVVFAQIHDARDDLLMLRLEGTKLLIEREGLPDVPVSRDYVLGGRIVYRIEAGRGRVRVWIQDVLRLDWSVSREGCYFKAGCYTQSNLERGDSRESFGEVTYYALSLTSD